MSMAFAAMPVFLLMALITYLQEPPLCAAPGNLGFLSSMWLMYIVMCVLHSEPWLSLVMPTSEKRPPND
jgi:succinate-acetate transporter protein